MKRSLARSLILVLFAGVVAMVLAASASAATTPQNYFVDAIHGKYAWGRYGSFLGANQFARVDLTTGAHHNFSAPAGSSTLAIGPTSDKAITAITYKSSYEHGQQLLRYDVAGGYTVLDSLPSGPTSCPSEMSAHSIEEDGTVLASIRSYTDSGDRTCAPDMAATRVKRYRAGSGSPEEVWVPGKYRRWILEHTIAASGNTLVLARGPNKGQPGGIVVLDTRKRKVVAKHRIGANPTVSLANPHSLYITQDSRRKTGKLMYWRIGEQKSPRTLFRGAFKSAEVCGNRVLLNRHLKLTLMTPTGRTVLRRSVAADRYFGWTACSGQYLHFVEVEDDEDYFGDSQFERHIINISKVPR